MKVKVVQRFIDRYSGDPHEIGDTIMISEERFAEICKVGHFVEVQGEEIPSETEAKPKRKTRTKK